MPNNYVLLEKITVGAAGAASVTFANIPQTGYTDLVVKVSARTSRAAVEDGLGLYFNADTTNYNWITLLSNGSSASSTNKTSAGFGTTWIARIDGNNSTANTFASVDVYIPNYASANQKSYSVDSVTENNATEAYAHLSAILFSSTAAVTSVTLVGANASFVANSTFYLYGVAKLGTTPAIAPKASGGDIIDTDGTYWYHTFLSSGTFTPAANLITDYLVVAGGGGGGYGANSSSPAGGGGAGGLRCTVGATGGGGSLESAISVTTNTAYTITVGGGGAGATTQATSSIQGSNSTFSTITATGGGYGGQNATINPNGGTGGSGGGGAGGGYGSAPTGGLGTTNQGFAGAVGYTSPNYGGGGGGGAGAIGNAGTTNGGIGGAGVTTVISGTSVAYAGGGGGGVYATGGVGGAGGTGGGGAGGTGSGTTTPTAGTANRGGGGGGAGATAGSLGTGTAGANGGSGIVIIRYPVAS